MPTPNRMPTRRAPAPKNMMKKPPGVTSSNPASTSPLSTHTYQLIADLVSPPGDGRI